MAALPDGIGGCDGHGVGAEITVGMTDLLAAAAVGIAKIPIVREIASLAADPKIDGIARVKRPC